MQLFRSAMHWVFEIVIVTLMVAMFLSMSKQNDNCECKDLNERISELETEVALMRATPRD